MARGDPGEQRRALEADGAGFDGRLQLRSSRTVSARAISIAADSVASLPPTRPLVLFGDQELAMIPAAVARYPGPIHQLSGGYSAFERQILTAPTLPSDPAAVTPEAISELRTRAALHARFTG